MPVTSILIDDVNRYIIDEIRTQLTKDVASALNIPEIDLNLRHDDTDKVLTDGKGNTGSENITNDLDTNTPTTTQGTMFLVTVSNEMDEDDIATAAIHQRSAYPIFQDKEVGVDVSPMYIKDTYRLEFQYTTSSKTEAMRLYDHIRIGVSQTRNILIHRFEYNIPIPKAIDDFVCDVYDLKSRLFDMELDEYFIKNSSSRIHPITDMSNPDNTILAINEVQKRVVGRFDFNPLPSDIEKDVDNNLYTVEFSYEVTIETPRAMVLRYPIMICNRPMPNKYIDYIKHAKDNEDDYNLTDNRYMSMQGDAFAIFESNREVDKKHNHSSLPLNIPNYDEFIPGTFHKGYIPLLSVLVSVNEDDRKSLFNLRDLDPLGLDGYVLDHLTQSGRTDCVVPYNSFVYISLYQDGKYFDAPILSIDSDLNISSRVELSLVEPVRVMISFLYDLAHLNSLTLSKYMREADLTTRLFREYVRMLSDFRHQLSNHRIDVDMIHMALYNIVGYFIGIRNYSTVRKLLGYLKENPRLYTSVLILIRDRLPADVENLQAKKILPNRNLDRLEHYDLPEEEPITLGEHSNYEDNLIFILPLRGRDNQ